MSAVRPIQAGGVAHGVVRPPGSKSLSNRALILAMLSRQPVEIEGLLESEDLLALRTALVVLGHSLNDVAGRLVVTPGSRPPDAEIDCHQSGTMARLMAAALAATPGRWRLDGAPRLRERPMRPLADALRQLGVEVDERGEPGHLPFVIHGRELVGGRIEVDAGASSQYLSGLLLAALAARGPMEIEATALTSAPYVAVTISAARQFGASIEQEGLVFRTRPGFAPPPRIEIEADASSAVYPAAAALLTAGEVAIQGLPESSLQADLEAFPLLERMGAEVDRDALGRLRVRGGRDLVALDADLSRVPDQVPTFAALAPFARGTTRLRGVAHLRIKESDRLAAMRTELGKLDVPVIEHEDGLEIPGVWAGGPAPSGPVEIDSWDDHRIAMSMALVGLRRSGVIIRDPQVVAKSWPGFWDVLEELIAQV